MLIFLLNCKASEVLDLSLGGAGGALHYNISLLSSKGAGKQGNIPAPNTPLWSQAAASEPLLLRDAPVLQGGSVHIPGLSHTLHWLMVFPKNICSFLNPGSTYLKGHIRQLAYLL